MDLKLPDDPIGTLVTLFETPSEPATAVIHLVLKQDLEEKRLRETLLEFFKKNPKLAATPRMARSGLRWDSRGSAEDALAVACLDPSTPVEELENTPIRLGSGPVLRMLLKERRHLYFSVHHSLSDGYGLLRFTTSVALDCFGLRPESERGTLPLDPREAEVGAKLRAPWSGLSRAWKGLKIRKDLAWNDPPLMLRLGREPARAVRRSRLELRLERASLDQLRPYYKSLAPEATLTDWLVLALSRATRDLALKRAGQDPSRLSGQRAAIFLPVDLRSRRPTPHSLFNNVGPSQIGVPVPLLDDLAGALRAIAAQTREIKQAIDEVPALATMEWLLRVWKWLKFDLSGVSAESWRYGCTLCFSNLVQNDRLLRASEVIAESYAAPPTLDPVGLMVFSISSETHLQICFGFADYAFESDEDRRFLVESFGKYATQLPAGAAGNA
jgi:hypothetical protein